MMREKLMGNVRQDAEREYGELLKWCTDSMHTHHNQDFSEMSLMVPPPCRSPALIACLSPGVLMFIWFICLLNLFSFNYKKFLLFWIFNVDIFYMYFMQFLFPFVYQHFFFIFFIFIYFDFDFPFSKNLSFRSMYSRVTTSQGEEVLCMYTTQGRIHVQIRLGRIKAPEKRKQ